MVVPLLDSIRLQYFHCSDPPRLTSPLYYSTGHGLLWTRLTQVHVYSLLLESTITTALPKSAIQPIGTIATRQQLTAPLLVDMALSPTLPAPLITPTATSGPRRTGFLSDCRDHWHWMRLELRDGCRSIRSHPGAACKTMVTHPLFAALWWFFAALYWNGVSSVVTGRTGEGTSWPLRDQGFSFPYYDNMQLSNYLLYASVAATGVRFLPIWPCCKPAIARTIFRRWLFLEGALFWFRAVSVVVTSCQNEREREKRNGT